MQGQSCPRSVAIESSVLQAALDRDHSPGYRTAKTIRDPVSTADMAIVEGCEG